MASTTGICLVLKTGSWIAKYNLATDTIKCALYTSTATNSPATTAYTSTNEVTGTNYTAGGNVLSGYVAGSGTNSGGVLAAYTSWANVSWTTASFTAASLIVYDTTTGVSNNAIFVYDFGGNFAVAAGTFTIIFPTADQNNAILRAA